MTDLLGPASANNAVTTRITESRTFGAVDTFFKPCSSPSAQDGTQVQSVWLNGMMAQIRAAIRGNGNLLTGAGPVVTEDNTNDGLLLLAAQLLIQRGQPIYAVDQGTANKAVANLSPAPPELVPGMEVLVMMAAAPTGATTLDLNGTTLPVVRQGKVALTGGEWAAGDLVKFGLISNTVGWQILRLTINDLTALVNNIVTNSTTINTTTLAYINAATPVGETHLYANAPGLVDPDISVTPTNSTMLTSNNFTGASFVEGSISCAMRNTDTSGFFLGFACQVMLNDVTSGTNAVQQSSYLGASATSTSTTQIQIPFGLAFKFQGLTAGHVYNLSIVARKAAAYGPVQTYDGTINGYHNGTNQ